MSGLRRKMVIYVSPVLSLVESGNVVSANRQSGRWLLLWISLIAATLFLSTFGRRLQHWVYENFSEVAASWGIGLLLVSGVLLLLRWLRSRLNKQPIRTLWVLGGALFFGICLVVILLDRPEERLHFVTFGLYGFVTGALFQNRSLFWSALSVLIFSGLDELYQWWLPDRVGDWRDVVMNALAGVVGLSLYRFGVSSSRHASR
jgi:uncharacterized membrane protein